MQCLFWLSSFAALASAQYLIEGSSFGHNDKISPNQHGIPGWHVSGDGQVPELYSDKVVLTPGYKGHTRGALWAETRNPQSNWDAQLEFRTIGPERGGGNLQIWYTKDGQGAIGSSSVYTAGNWDGLAIVIDPYGGKGGGIRGFMNDGTIDYRNYHSVDSLAFGHCDYSYRNLGRPSKIRVKQEVNNFEVSVDDRVCFSTDKIQMPSDYYFGITAATAETPDSFEVNKFMVFNSASNTREEPFRSPPPPPNQQQPFETHPNTPASQYGSSEAQFEDLHNRLQTLSNVVETLSHNLNGLLSEVQRLGSDSAGRHNEIIRNLPTTADKLHSLDAKLDGLDGTLRGLDSRFGYLQTSVKDHHRNLADSLPSQLKDVVSSNGPRMGLLIFIFVIVQVALVAAYQLYKKRSKQGPKKYL